MLLAWWTQRWKKPPPPPLPPCGLGIDSLPDGLGLLATGTPVAFLVQEMGDPMRWLRAVLSDALQGGPVFLLAQDAAQMDMLLETPKLKAAFDNGNLSIFILSSNFHDQVQHHGLQPALAEAQRVGLSRAHAVFFVGTQQWLLGQRLTVLDRLGSQLSRWCLQRPRPVVMVFVNAPKPQDVMQKLLNLWGIFHHVGVLESAESRSVLKLERWNGSEGAVFQSNYGLQWDAATARLVYDGSHTQGPSQQLMEAPDQHKVIVTAQAVANQIGLPADWIVIPSLDQVEAAVQGSIAATVMLHGGLMEEYDALARLVHHLRLTYPRTLKIVVREAQGKLRTNTEQALTQLGATSVIYKEVGFSRLLQFLQHINRQSYEGELHPDYEQALAAFLPKPVRGYLPPSEFCEVVQSTLERTSVVGLKHTIVRLHLLDHVAQIDAIRSCQMLRDGDLLSSGRDSLFAFLFACREPDLDQTLERVFKLPLSELFSSQTSDSTDNGVGIMLDQLRQEIRDGLPDIAVLLDKPAPAPGRPSGGPSGGRAATPPPEKMPTTTLPSLKAASAEPAQKPRLRDTPSMRPKAIAQRTGSSLAGAPP